MDRKNYTYFLFISLLLLTFLKAEFQIEEISFENDETKLDNLFENKYYHIKPKSPSNISKYLKIMVKDKKGNNNSYLNFVNYAISFYQGDSTFSDRKQLSYGSLNTITMWLTKEQVKDGFYLSIETTYSSCDYSLTICQKNVAEILPGEQYSYYVTEENKEMIFSIKKEKFETEAEKYITFWALGNDSIGSLIKGNYPNYENDIKKHPNYNAYIIEVQNQNQNYEYNITITGKTGNYIKIGNLACSNQECKITYFYEGVEYFGLLISDYEEKACFNRKMLPDRSFGFVIYDDYDEKMNTTINSLANLICIEKPEGYNAILYSLKSTRIGEAQTGLIKTFPLTYSYNYSFTINKGETIRFFPLNLENYEFLTYYIFAQGGKKNNVFIYNCEDYPLCIRNNDITNTNNTPIQGAFWSYSVSFNKKDFNNFSPISKSQKMVMFTCEGDQKCSVYPRLYNEKSYIKVIPKYTEYRMVRKGSEDNLYLEDFEYFLIETVSGEISINIKKLDNKNSNYNEFSYKNIHVYNLLNSDGKKVLFVNIKGDKDSVYSIKSYKPQIIASGNLLIYNLDTRGNFLFKIQSNDINNTIIYQLYDKLTFNFYPIGCDITAVNVNRNGDFPTYALSNHKFYQQVYSYDKPNVVGALILPEKNKECLIYGSLFTLENNNKYYEQGTYLTENLPQTFLFNGANNEFVYIYYFIGTEEKINIEFNLLNEGYYIVTFNINDIESEDKYTIDKTKTIVLEKSQWENICISNQQICKISFNVKSSKEEDSFLEINVYPEPQNDSNPSDSSSDSTPSDPNESTPKSKDPNNNSFGLIIAFSIAGLIVIALVVFFIVKCKRKNKNDLDFKVEKLTP